MFADPDDTEAKELQADAYEQLGYQQEVPQYRSIFLGAAKELREGVAVESQVNTDSLDTILAMPIDLLFDFVGVHLNGPGAGDLDLRINVTFNPGGPWTMWIRNGVLNARATHADNADLTLEGSKPALAALLLNPADADKVIGSGAITHEGDLEVLASLAAVIDAFDPHFNLSTP